MYDKTADGQLVHSAVEQQSSADPGENNDEFEWFDPDQLASSAKPQQERNEADPKEDDLYLRRLREVFDKVSLAQKADNAVSMAIHQLKTAGSSPFSM